MSNEIKICLEIILALLCIGYFAYIIHFKAKIKKEQDEDDDITEVLPETLDRR